MCTADGGNPNYNADQVVVRRLVTSCRAENTSDVTDQLHEHLGTRGTANMCFLQRFNCLNNDIDEQFRLAAMCIRIEILTVSFSGCLKRTIYEVWNVSMYFVFVKTNAVLHASTAVSN